MNIITYILFGITTTKKKTKYDPLVSAITRPLPEITDGRCCYSGRVTELVDVLYDIFLVKLQCSQDNIDADHSYKDKCSYITRLGPGYIGNCF